MASKPAETPARPLKEPELAIDEFFLEDRDIEAEKRRVRKRLGMTVSDRPVRKKTLYERLRLDLRKAGLSLEPGVVIRRFLIITLSLLILGSIVLGYAFLLNDVPFWLTALYLLGWFVIGFAVIYPLVHLAFKSFLSYRRFKRRLAVERVLPDFLRLVATNYRSGMLLDEALIKSNRPRFGIFSKEIELVAKTSKVKGDLSKALEIFSKKFDSKVLQRAVNSINMSIGSGSNISSLLEEIAGNITRMRTMRAAMAANVKNYIIFIVVAGVIIAPLMFSMSYVMNDKIVNIRSSVMEDAAGSSPISFGFFSFRGKGGVEAQDFDVFAILMLLTTSVVSAFLIGL
ncbi:MAG: type II secretion system F family protein, partial [Candidatus Woesearchaeota archaeon]